MLHATTVVINRGTKTTTKIALPHAPPTDPAIDEKAARAAFIRTTGTTSREGAYRCSVSREGELVCITVVPILKA
jgi:hypothetical protein